MNSQRNITVALLFFMLVLTGCEGIGTADFGEVAAEGTSDGTTGSGTASFTFSGIDSIDQVTDSSARINWTHNASAVAYEIYNVTSGVSYVATVSAPTATYSLAGLSNATAYKYRVRAKDSSGNLDSNTNDVSFTTNLAPDPPSGLSLQDPSTSPNFDDTPTIRVSGVKNGDTIKLFTDSSCSTQVGSVVASGTTADITTSSLAAAAYTFYANATNAGSNASNCSSATVSYTVELCPTGYVAVPENTTLGVSAFCVMQFEAKNDGAGNPVSQASGTPWVSINQTNAKSECTSLGAKYDLISNPEWMTVAFEIEKTDSNWSGSSVGSGMLSRGHTDNSPASALAVTNTGDPYDGTGNNSGQAAGSGWEQKRTHTLSNGATVWDIAGNVWEWTDWSLGGGLTSGPTSCTAAWTELPDVACGALAAADYLPDNPSGQTAATYNANYGLGRLYGGSGGAALRGGLWLSGSYAGAFTLNLYGSPTGTYTSIGFRCVYRP
jgi:formylglycine-generating enzyme required for sulfatase activity